LPLFFEKFRIEKILIVQIVPGMSSRQSTYCLLIDDDTVSKWAVGEAHTVHSVEGSTDMAGRRGPHGPRTRPANPDAEYNAPIPELPLQTPSETEYQMTSPSVTVFFESMDPYFHEGDPDRTYTWDPDLSLA
jgi:hypothetical protein